ncbi:MAG: glycosyltransferase [Candidatus Coatesbacteria bacterium]|nr:glycosyltransferase [Candidatus Coatesbacteria bacterium]
MLRVLQIYKDYYPPVFGGIEKHLSLLCAKLSLVAHVDVLVANRKAQTEQEFINGIKVLKAGTFGRLLSAPLSPLFGSYLSRERYDILHFHLPNPTAVLSYLLVRPPGAVVVTWHSDIVRQRSFLPLYRPFLMRFLNLCDAILPTSERYARTSPFLTLHLDKCHPIPLGIDVSRFSPTEKIKHQAAELRATYGGRVVLFVGLLRYYKGLKFLIDAMQSLDATLVIVGEGPMRAELESYCQERRLKVKVFFAGAVDEEILPAYYHSCDVFCLPSIYRSEAFGVSQLEAMACGKPVVSTALDTGVPYVNLDGKTGLIVPPMDSAALAEALRSLLSDQVLAARLGEAARGRVLTEFTAEEMAQSVLAVYRSLVERRKAKGSGKSDLGLR